jgi:hypothetical protein
VDKRRAKIKPNEEALRGRLVTLEAREAAAGEDLREARKKLDAAEVRAPACVGGRCTL